MKTRYYLSALVLSIIISGCSSVTTKPESEKPRHYQLSPSQITQFSKALTDKLVFQCQGYLENDQWLNPEQDLVLESDFLLRRVSVDPKKVSYRINSNNGDSVLELTIKKKRSKTRKRKICQYRLDVHEQNNTVLSERIINVIQWQKAGGEKIISQYLQNPALDQFEEDTVSRGRISNSLGYFIGPVVQALFYGLAGR